MAPLARQVLSAPSSSYSDTALIFASQDYVVKNQKCDMFPYVYL